MIERKIDTDTIIVGREIKISDLETRKVDLEANQIATQVDRDEYDALTDNMKEKHMLPIDFTEEIEVVTTRITKYKDAKVGEIKEPIEVPKFEAINK